MPCPSNIFSISANGSYSGVGWRGWAVTLDGRGLSWTIELPHLVAKELLENVVSAFVVEMEPARETAAATATWEATAASEAT